jgi:hypothetical protein
MKDRNNLPVLPAITLMPPGSNRPGHVVLLTADIAKTAVFSLAELHNAFIPDTQQHREPPVYANNIKTMRDKAKNKALKKQNNNVTQADAKIGQYRRHLRIYLKQLLKLTYADLPEVEKMDLAEYVKFTRIYSALLEVKEKGAKTFRRKETLHLLSKYPMPQDRS